MRLVPCCGSNKITPDEGPGQVLFYEWKCVARGLASEPYLGNVIGGTIEVETSGWADREPRFWHIDGRGGKCGTGKLGYPADATMTMTVALTLTLSLIYILPLILGLGSLVTAPR
eukprot:scaffold43986_cov59-Phaeocystis_antarctica.AAC.2